jgi:hypothetical protein
VESDPIRTRALELLQDKFDCRANGTVLGQIFKKYTRKGGSYLEELQAAKLVLNLRGVGHDTLRYWETPAVGTCMVSTLPPIDIPHNFEDGKHVVFIKPDLSDLIDTLKALLDDDTVRETIATQGHAFALAHHTHIHRARQLLAHIDAIS